MKRSLIGGIIAAMVIVLVPASAMASVSHLCVPKSAFAAVVTSFEEEGCPSESTLTAFGEEGPVGPTGPEGKPGATGAKGEKGEKGTTGATGPEGPKGAKGETGERGLEGKEGPTGKEGTPGGEIKMTTASGTTGAQPENTKKFYSVACSSTTKVAVGWGWSTGTNLHPASLHLLSAVQESITVGSEKRSGFTFFVDNERTGESNETLLYVYCLES